MNNMYRTHYCGKINELDINKKITVSGWIHRIRDHNKIIFIDLRDITGIVQIVIKDTIDIFKKIKSIKLETVILVDGVVIPRNTKMINHNISTGTIEIISNKIKILNKAKNIPFSITDDKNENISESIRLKYRYLDLRREKIKNNILLRNSIIYDIRKKMHEMGFIEFQTPILTKSSPEGARDYLVPSRLHRNKFYALPQAPQLFKQLLMISGFDKYFQIAPCFRDEDARADRSPGEFYQLDIEMSFVTQENIFTITENLLHFIFTKYSSDKIITKTPFTKIKYKDALNTYGTDKPDLRNPLKISDITQLLQKETIKFFNKNGYDVIKMIKIDNATKNLSDISNTFCKKIIEQFKADNIMLGYIIIKNTKPYYVGSLSKVISENEIDLIREKYKINEECIIFLIPETSNEPSKINIIRDTLGNDLDIIDKNVFKFCWITDIPMYTTDQDGKIIFSHNPFSMPIGGLKALKNTNPLDITAYQYDIVCNGIELSSGAIRNHNPNLIYKAFEIAGYTRQEVNKNFNGLINALKFGAPPHGGIAPGIDRIIMLLANESNIREVIAFPLNQQAQDLMLNSPSNVTDQQLKELNINIK